MERGLPVLEREHTEEVQYKIFDELAYLRLMTSDLNRYGSIQPDTWRQVHDGELTFVAEGINAPLSTDFILKMTEDGLVDERGVPLMRLLDHGKIAAEQAALRDSRLSFNVRRSVLEHGSGLAVERMMTRQGTNTIVECSAFAEEAHAKYGDALMESIGMQPKRKLGFMRIYQKLSNNELKLTSISVDNSDPAIFRDILEHFGVHVPLGTTSDELLGYRYEGQLDRVSQELLPDQLRYMYDKAMSAKHGGEFNAGRRSENDIDAWKFIEAQKDLVEHYFTKLEELAKYQPNDVLAKRELTYSFWAALKDRMAILKKGNGIYNPRYIQDEETRHRLLDQEMRMSLDSARARHEVLIACGGMMAFGAGTDLLQTNPSLAMNSIMNGGDGNDENAREKWQWKKGQCVVPKCPTRPKKTDVGPCSVCKCCQLIYDTGSDPVKRYQYMNN